MSSNSSFANLASVGMKASRRRLYRQSKRLLIRLMARRWSGPRRSLEPAVRGFLRARSRNYLLHLAGNRAFALAAAATLLAIGTARASPPIFLSDVAEGDGGFVINGIDSGDNSGRSVSGAGDVNGDGVPDVIVGAHGADPGGISNAGESYVVFGKADGTPVDVSDIVGGVGGFAIIGIDVYAGSRWSVSGAGDVNGDGLDDVIVGAPNASPIEAYEGESYVVFGKADTAAVSVADIVAGIGGFVINGAEFFNRSGWSVSGAGDVNGDGLDDVIVGIRRFDGLGDVIVGIRGHRAVGASYVVFGKADTAEVNLADVVAGDGGFVMFEIGGNDQPGWSVSGAGDVNGDGLDDVIVGAPGAYPGGINDAGESYVVFGKADTAAVELADVAAGDGGFVIKGIDEDDWSGYSVSGAGDVNGDGLDDVIVGAPSYYGDGPGESYVVFGNADTAAVELANVAAGDGGFVINGINPYGGSGFSVSGAGDVNGDGLGDVIVGAPQEDHLFSDDGYGRSYVVLGKADTAAVNLWDVAAGDGGFIMYGAGAAVGLSGWGVSGAGDVNGDGLDDFIVGGPAGRGRSFVVFSPVVWGDLNGDGSVDVADLLLLLANRGPCPEPCVPYCLGDLNRDCTVDVADLLILVHNFGGPP